MTFLMPMQQCQNTEGTGTTGFIHNLGNEIPGLSLYVPDRRQEIYRKCLRSDYVYAQFT